MKYADNLFTRRDPRPLREPTVLPATPPAQGLPAEIRGEFQGEMTARKKLVIHASGRVTGKIRYGKMLVQEGGEMSGDIGALGAAASIPPPK